MGIIRKEKCPKFRVWPLSEKPGKFIVYMTRRKRNGSNKELRDDFEEVSLKNEQGFELVFTKEEVIKLINSYKFFYKQLNGIQKKEKKVNPETVFPHIWEKG